MMIERDPPAQPLWPTTGIHPLSGPPREIGKEANAQVANIVVAAFIAPMMIRSISWPAAALLAKRLGAQSVMSLVNSMSYSSLVIGLGVDAVVSPKALTVSSILQYVRRGRIRSVHSLREGYGEVIEAEAVGTSSVVGMRVSEINSPGTRCWSRVS